jgi:hypothetical protein
MGHGCRGDGSVISQESIHIIRVRGGDEEPI